MTRYEFEETMAKFSNIKSLLKDEVASDREVEAILKKAVMTIWMNIDIEKLQKPNFSHKRKTILEILKELAEAIDNRLDSNFDEFEAIEQRVIMLREEEQRDVLQTKIEGLRK